MRAVREHVGWGRAAALAPLGLWWGWSIVSVVRSDWGLSPALPYLLCPLVLLAGVWLGGVVARHPDSVAVRVALVIAGLILVIGVVMVTEPGKGPTGYANANAALAVQFVAICGLGLLSTARERRGGVLVALALGVLAVALNRSTAGTAVALPIFTVVALVAWLRPQRRWWTAMSVAVGAAVVGFAGWVILRAAESTPFPDWAVRAFDPARERLWQDAVQVWADKPLTGAGPGSFAQSSVLAMDPDTMAAHSSILQIGAETGWVGVTLLTAMVLAAMLWATRGRTPQAVIAVTAVAALLVHSMADHLLEFGSVVLAVGIVIGWAGATGRRRQDADSEELDVTKGERPVLG